MFDREHDVLSVMKKVDSIHVIKLIAAYSQENTNYIGSFIFPWAQGNLREFWEKHSGQHRDISMIEWSFKQIQGIANALKSMDDKFQDDGRNLRHGDLKPENILWFSGTMSDDPIGHLVIADVGLAKIHTEVTRMRFGPTTATAATKLYAPPELTSKPLARVPRSRRYDIWSMGCICLEFIIWLMYGHFGQEKFLKGSETGETSPLKRFYSQTLFRTKVHSRVIKWANHMQKNPRCSSQTTLRKLLDLVLGQLLVPSPSERHTAQDFADAMNSICSSLEELRHEQPESNDQNRAESIDPPNNSGDCGWRSQYLPWNRRGRLSRTEVSIYSLLRSRTLTKCTSANLDPECKW